MADQQHAETYLDPRHVDAPTRRRDAPPTVAARPTRVLLAEADALLRGSLARLLGEGGGCAVTAVGNAEAAAGRLERGDFDVLLLDAGPPVRPGVVALLDTVRDRRLDLNVILVGGAAGSEGLRRRAYDGLSRPVARDALLRATARAAENVRLRREVARRRLLDDSDFAFVGASEAAAAVRSRATALAAAGRPTLIVGEAGVGKVQAARFAHAASARSGRPFLAVPSSRGHDIDELLRAVDGGTLVLRGLDVGSSAVRQEFDRASRDEARRRGTWLAATARGPGDRSSPTGPAVLPVPALRDRAGDVAELARHLARTLAARRLEPAAAGVLGEYDWPGNARELRLVIERVCLIETDSRTLRAATLTACLGGSATGPHADAPEPLAEIEKRAILRALAEFDGHRVRTATALGIGVRTLGIKIKKWREAGELADARS